MKTETIIQDFKIVKSEKKKLFQAASISKTLTAVLILRLVQEGKLKLNEDVNKYLKSWKLLDKKGNNKKITIKELLTHTGKVNVSGFRGFSRDEKIPSLIEILNGKSPYSDKVIVDQSLKKKFNYSGGGYLVLQKVVEDISNKKFEKVVHDKVIKPLNMKNSTFRQDKKISKRKSIGHDKKGNKIKGGFFIYPEKSAAGLWTTSEDLGKFLLEVQLSYKGKSNKILSKKIIKKMLTPACKSDEGFIGLGFYIKKIKNKKIFFHRGANVGFKSLIAADLKGNGIVILTDSEKPIKFDFKKLI